VDWFDLAQDSVKWRALLKMATTLGSQKMPGISWVMKYQLFKMASALWS